MYLRTLSCTLSISLLASMGFTQSPAEWKSIASAGVESRITHKDYAQGPGFELAFDFKGQAGFALAELGFVQDLPPNFEFAFWIKAESMQNDFEFKLMDPTGTSVWWVKKAAWIWPGEWTRMVIRRSQLVYAWGPDRTLFPKSGSVQFGIAANFGGRGKVEIAGFDYRELPPTAPFSKEINRTKMPGGETLSLKGLQAVGGLKISGLKPGQKVEVRSKDSKAWTVGPAAGKVAYLATPELETEQLMVRSAMGTSHLGFTPQPSSFSTHPYQVWESIAKDQRRGLYPKHLLGEQSFFTVVGALNSDHEGLINEHGLVELRRMGPSLEPFLHHGGKLVTWAEVQSQPRLLAGVYPIPSVVWQGPVQLVTEVVAPEGTQNQLSVQYRLHNTSRKTQVGSLLVALRPIQVNPSWQSLNLNPLIAPIRNLKLNRGEAKLDDGWTLRPDSPAVGGVTELGRGDLAPYLVSGAVPRLQAIQSDTGTASALWKIPYRLQPGESKAVTFSAFGPGETPSRKSHAELRKQSQQTWQKWLQPDRLAIGGSGRIWVETLLANLAYILVHRDGSAIHPGSRTYQRSWIRDGALTCTALLQFGINDPVKEFINWYSTGIREDGWVPCVMDSRGPDPLAEHDSHGQFIYLLATYYRFTGDQTLVQKHFAKVKKIVEQIEYLRAQRSTDQFRLATGIERGYFGLFPESASHEGYMDIHRHSYWDDFFGVKGLRDAAFLAQVISDERLAKSYTEKARDFEEKFVQSIAFTQKHHSISYIPGCVELGDFDATSTAIGIYPGGGLSYVPKKDFDQTFDRYWKFFNDRELNKIEWRDYTPYEVRVLSAMVLLGRPERAHHMMNWFLRDLRPLGWKHWAEVGYLDPKPGRWIGDMPHTWVGSEFIKAFRLMLVHERESDGKLVFGLGIKPDWLTGKEGLRFTNLPTHFGPVSFTGALKGKTAVFQLTGSIKRDVPMALHSPWRSGVRQVKVNGVLAPNNVQEISIPRLPAKVEIQLQ